MIQPIIVCLLMAFKKNHISVDLQTNSDDDEPLKGPPEMSCDHAREKLTNSIRQQWRKLKHHVERLDSQSKGYHSQTFKANRV